MKVTQKTADGGVEPRLQGYVEVDGASREESSSDHVNAPAAPDAGDMMSILEAAEVGGGAYVGMDTIEVHTEEHIEALGRTYGDGNIPDMLAAVSCLVASVSKTPHAVSEVQTWASGHMAACPMDGGS